MKVLVVDDSGVIRRVLIAALARADITDVDQAADGEEAVVAAQTQEYDLILMDWNMPNMQGIDAIHAIRAKGKGKKTPIIMVTTEAERSRVIDALKAGATHYIIKPFDPATVVTRIQEVMTRLPEA